ncbi:MAG: hypothetical protein R3300_07485 [Candidatus Promineifilaceae bacterium]|nr:hypothetical protein [Candidatus Promineifilaceae bacterium]
MTPITRHKLGTAALVTLMLTISVYVVGVVAAPRPTLAQTASDGNLLFNPSFEGQYSAYVPPGGHPDCPWGVCATAQMAPGWTPYWQSHDDADDPWIIRMPEYKRAETGIPGPPRVHSGSAAQQYFTFYGTHRAGFYQRVDVIPGQAYCFEVWGHSWSAQDDDYLTGPEDGELLQNLGIHPQGSTDWTSAAVVWGEGRIQPDTYGLFGVCTEAQAETITVFTFSEPRWAVKHNDVYWDDASLSPFTGTLTASPAGPRIWLLPPGSSEDVTHELTIDVPDDLSLRWQGTIAAGADLAIELGATSGTGDGTLEIAVESAGLQEGRYEATVIVELTDSAGNSWNGGNSVATELIVVVTDEIYRHWMPLVLGN